MCNVLHVALFTSIEITMAVDDGQVRLWLSLLQRFVDNVHLERAINKSAVAD